MTICFSGGQGWRGLRAMTSRISRRQAASSGGTLARLKTDVVKELPGRSCQYETSMRVIRFRLAFAESGFLRAVKMIFPEGFILKGKACPARTQTGASRIFRHFSAYAIGLRSKVRVVLTPLAMLYEQWHDTAGCPAQRSGVARSGLRPSLDLRAIVRRRRILAGGAGEIICPQGHSPEFIFSLLSAWRSGKTVCPLEAGQTLPDSSRRRPNIAPSEMDLRHDGCRAAYRLYRRTTRRRRRPNRLSHGLAP